MTLRHYQAFVAVCSEGSMSKAAETLYISQSAVSQLIKDLESHYNTRLFYRVSHKLVLTEAGKTLYRHALHMMLYNQSIERDMLAGRGSQVLRIGTNNAMIVLDLACNYKKEHPEFSFSVIHAPDDELMALVNTSQIDFAITAKPSAVTDTEFVSEFLAEIPFCFICAKDTKLSPLLEDNSPRLTLEELSQFTLFINTMTDEIINGLHTAFDSRNLPLNIAGRLLDLTALIQYVLQDFGIGITHKNNFYVRQSFLKTITVEDLSLVNSLYFLQRKCDTLPHVRSFIDYSLKNFRWIAEESVSRYFMPKLT